MTTYMVKNASLVAGAAVALLAGNASALVADAQTGDSWSSTSTATEASETTAGSGVVERDKVEGSFSFTQGEVTPTGVIARNLSGSSTVLCGNEGVATGEAASYEDWVVEVMGEVSNPFTATLAEMSDVQGTASLVMGCSCLGNPVDGRASANADVLGISFASIDHSMWWYRDIDINQWHLYVQDTPTAAHGRGLGQAKVYTQDGELVACMTQEAMIRVPEEDLKK